MKKHLFVVLSFLFLFSSKSFGQCSVTTNQNQSISCATEVQLIADSPLWKEINTPIASDIKDFIFYGDTIFAVGANNTIRRSTDFGLTFTSINSPTSDHKSIAQSNNGKIYIAGYSFSGNKGRVYRSDNHGLSWDWLLDETSKDYWDITTFNDTVWAVGVNRSDWTGRVIRSTNNGDSWTELPANIPANTTPYSVFVNQNRVVIGASTGVTGVIYYSDDRGATFEEVTTLSNGNPMPGIFTIAFVNSNIGFAAGLNGKIIKTTDGGNTWSLVYEDGLLNRVNTLSFKNSSEGFAFGNSGLALKTMDGGNTWTEIELENAYSRSSSQVHNGFVYSFSGAFGGSCKLLTENEYSYSWNNASLLNNASIANPLADIQATTTFTVTATDRYGCEATNEVTIELVNFEVEAWHNQTILPGESVQLKAFHNAGSSANVSYEWTPATNISATNIANPIVNPNTTTTYVVVATIDGTSCTASNTVTVTTHNPLINAGANLFCQYGGNVSMHDVSFDEFMLKENGIGHHPFSKVKFFDNMTGFMTTGNGNMVLKSEDFGNHWSTVYENDAAIYAMSFLSSENGIFGDVNGNVTYTNDGGLTWETENLFTSQVTVVQMITPNVIYAASDDGELKKTTNGGNTWSTVNTGTADHISDIYFLTENMGWIACVNLGVGRIYKTTDGNNFTQLSESFQYINKIHFINQNVGFAADNSAKRTTDGGQTWTTLNIDGSAPINMYLNTIEFIDENVGFMGRPLIKTTDGGANWTQIETSTPPFYSISAINDSLIYGVSQWNFVKYLNPKFEWTPELYLDNPNVKKPIFTPGLTTDYYIKVTTLNNYHVLGGKTVTVPDPCIPQVNININDVNNTVEFSTPLAEAPYPNLFSFVWRLGDGTQINQAAFTHQFAAAGYHHVYFKATSLHGCDVDTSFVISIGNAAQTDCHADFLYILDHQTNQVDFTHLSLGGGISHYLWYFDDGQISFDENPSHTYSQNGIYNVCLSVFNQNTECYNTHCRQIYVNATGSHCMAKFTHMVDTLTRKVTFENQSTHNPNTFAWSFGDGQTSAIENPEHTYANNGFYFTHLRINQNTCVADYVDLINVNMPAGTLQAYFGFVLEQMFNKTNEFPVKFYAASNGVPAKYYWDFGDGKKDSLTNQPLHIYEAPGTYEVCLTISDHVSNQSYTACRNVTIVGTGIQDQASAITFYPNPANQSVVIENEIGNTISIIDNLGRIVHKSICNSDKEIINIAELAQGVYTIKIDNKANSRTERLIVRK